MKDKKFSIGQLNNIIIPAGIVLIAFTILSIVFDFYYDINDDIMLGDIVGGQFTGTPSGYAIYVLYPLAFAIALLSRVLPAVPWFGMFLVVGIMISCFFVLKRVWDLVPILPWKIIAMVILTLSYSGLILYPSIYIQYSFVAAVLAGAGGFLLITSDGSLKRKEFIKQNIPSVALICLGFMLRWQMVALLGPMLLVSGISGWVNSTNKEYKPFNKTNFIKYLMLAGIIAGLLVLSFGINKIAYSQSEWKSFEDYNKVRTELYDFQANYPDYENNSKLYDQIGIAKEETVLLDNYNLALSEKFDTNNINAIVDYNENELGIKHFKYTLKDTFLEYKYRISHRVDNPWTVIFWALYILCIGVSILYLRYENLIQIFCLFFARTLGWIYPMIRGRLEMRIINSFYICELLLLIGILLVVLVKGRKGNELKHYNVLNITVMGLISFIMAFLLIWTSITNVKNVINEKNRREATNSSWEELQDYFAAHEESFYIVDVYSSVRYSDTIFRKRSKGVTNSVICGGWTNESPLYSQKLSQFGINSVVEDLVAREDVYFVAYSQKDLQWLIDYYESMEIIISLVEEAHIGSGDNEFSVYSINKE